MKRHLHEQNRHSWNAATRAHNSHKDDQARFLREGGDKLFPEELELLGDLRGKRVAHLQCNAGQDTLCLARRGAAVVGVDISDEAVEFARRLSLEADIPARFVCSDVYDWLATTAAGDERFDVVFASYGAYPWLSDIGQWASGIAQVLVPGGRFVLVEFHPFVMCFDETGKLATSYFGRGDPITTPDGVGDYVARAGAALAPSGYVPGETEFQNPHPSHEFAWGIGDIVTAVLDAGLRLEVLREYPYANGYPVFDGARALEGRRWGTPPGMPEVPQMFALAARR